MTASQTLSVISSLLLWRSHQPFDVAIAVDGRNGVSIAVAPCACRTAVVEVDWPTDDEFRSRLDVEVRGEIERGEDACVCDRPRYRPDFALMGCDDPDLAGSFRVECMNCDATGPPDPFEARRRGWTAIGSAEEFPGPAVDFTHLGLCPSCRDADVGGTTVEAA